jgi:alpha-1,3-mannosyltransferase
MKILHVSHNFWPVTGGVERNIEDICRGLIELGHQSDVCCIRVPGTPREETFNGIRIHRLRALNAKFYKIAPGVARLAKKYDVVHVHGLGFFSDYLGLAKPFHRKWLVLSTHGGIFHTKKLSMLKKPYFHLWSRFVMKAFDAVVAVSHSDKALFSKIRRNVALIPNSIDYGKLSSVRRRPEKGLFIFVGRMSRNKRIDNLIRTIAEINGLGRDATLVVIGEDWEGQRTWLEGLAKSLGIGKNVIFAGRISRPSILQYFERAQFFVSASEYEGFGISVLEAMAAGLPVVVNSIDAFRTFIENGKNGLMTDFSDHRKAAKRIAEIMGSRDLGRISDNAKRTAKKYDYKEAANRFERLYQDISRTSS